MKIIKKIMKRILILLNIDIRKANLYLEHIKGKDKIANVYKTNNQKNALIRYIVYPFLNKNRYERHQNEWQVKEIARIISKHGYNVDVVSFESPFLKYNASYDLLIDISPGFNDVPCKYLNKDCVQIAYMTGMNPSVARKNEDDRLLALKKRRGWQLPKERLSAALTKDIEKYNAFFYIGNSYNLASYSEFNLPPVYFMRNNGYTFDSLDLSVKDSKSFVYFASSGQVHKGLDLLLEVFAQDDFPCELYICSCVMMEKEFCKCYERELFHTNNIHTLGFVDVGGDKFWEIMQKSTYVLMPSCSEGIAGSVLTCMSAGIIPIVSRERGFEDDEVINLTNCNIETIQKVVIEYSGKSSTWINDKSCQVKYIADTKYSKKSFSAQFESSLLEVMEK